MALDCTPQELLANATCFDHCLSSNQLRAIMVWLLCQIANDGSGFPPQAKGSWHTSGAKSIVATGVPQLILNSDTDCYKAIIVNDKTSTDSMYIGGDAAPGDQPIEIPVGTSYLLEAPDGRWFNIHEMGIVGTAADTYSVLFFTDP